MPPLTVPESFVLFLAAFQPCFTAPTFRTFRYLVAGWAHCPGRRPVTAAVVAAGVAGSWHVPVFHRFFARARWDLDALGGVVFRLALRWVPPDQPLYVLVDDTLARKRGKAIALGSMHHDPLLSTVRKAFSSFGHVWVILALWVPLPFGFGPRGAAKGVAVPLLFRLLVGRQRGNRADARAARPRGAACGPCLSGSCAPATPWRPPRHNDGLRAEGGEGSDGQAAPVGGTGRAAEGRMIKLVVLYGQPTDAGAFERHYLGTHVPLGDKVPGLQCAEFARAVATLDGSPPPYYRVADVYFDSLEQLRAAFASPEGQALAADAANFVTGGATVLVCEIDAKRTGARGAAGAGGAGRPG